MSTQNRWPPHRPGGLHTGQAASTQASLIPNRPAASTKARRHSRRTKRRPHRPDGADTDQTALRIGQMAFGRTRLPSDNPAGIHIGQTASTQIRWPPHRPVASTQDRWHPHRLGDFAQVRQLGFHTGQTASIQVTWSPRSLVDLHTGQTVSTQARLSPRRQDGLQRGQVASRQIRRPTDVSNSLHVARWPPHRSDGPNKGYLVST